LSYYDDLRKSDITYWMLPLIEQRVYGLRRSDGFFKMCAVTEPHAHPWHHINYAIGNDCYYLHGQLFGVISPRTPVGQFIPRKCQSCWKIVIRPKNLKQLFLLENILTQLGWPSKCGIEQRSYTPLSKHRYGGYIYNSSIDEGLDRLDVLRARLLLIPGAEEIECFLKRACTEMEMAFPDSRTWEVTEEQNRIEDILDNMLIKDVSYSLTGKHLINKLHITWIEWAAEIGDETYLEYTGGKRLYPEAIKYERKVEGTEAGSPDDKTVAPSPTAGEVPKGKGRRTTKEKK